MRTIVDILDYIEAHLDEELSVALACSFSGYSPYHFQRLFSNCTGTTLGNYITRRRLTRAAQALSTTQARIIEIAQNAGYESQEAFTRAFKDVFGQTPAAYRKQGMRPVLKAFPVFDAEMVRHLKAQPSLTSPQIIRRDSFVVIGVCSCVQRGHTETIGTDLWPEFLKHIEQIPEKRGIIDDHHITYGLLLNDGSSDGPEYTTFNYMAGVEVSPQAVPPEGFRRVEIPAQQYAVFTHSGPVASLPLTNKYIWGVWAPQNKVRIACAPDMEVYRPSKNPDSPMMVEIWVPLVMTGS